MVEEFLHNGSIERAKDVLEKEKAKKVFIVHGEKSYSLSGAREKIEECMDGIAFNEFTNFSSNPKIEEIKEGIDCFNGKDHDLVIAVGGGSAIDVAKLINIFSFQKHKPKKYILKEKEIENEGLPLLAVPTTAGTGSEATHFAVVYRDEKKYSVAHDYILPDYVILDPELTLTLSKYQTACTGMDALCQGIESYWSVNSTAESKKYARKAIELTLDNIAKAVKNIKNLEIRKKMLKGANYSGKAINISKTTAPHACSYIITTKYGIPHGHAVAMMMKEFLKYNGTNMDKVVDQRGKEYFKDTIEELFSFLKCSSPLEASELFERKMNEVGLELSLSELHNDVPTDELIKGVNLERLKNNPIKVDERDIRWILNKMD